MAAGTGCKARLVCKIIDNEKQKRIYSLKVIDGCPPRCKSEQKPRRDTEVAGCRAQRWDCGDTAR